MQADLTEYASDIERFDAFIDANWDGVNKTAWTDALAREGWLSVDWPESLGGTGWNLTRQWLWANACAEANCPLPGTNLTVIAPLIIQLGSDEQRALLEHFSSASPDWHIELAPAFLEYGNGYLDGVFIPRSYHALILVDDQLIMLEPGENETFDRFEVPAAALLGSAHGAQHLALYQSPWCNLVTQLTVLRTLQRSIGEDSDLVPLLTELELAVRTLEAMFLQRKPALMSNLRDASTRITAIELLADMMGYYLLLQDAPGETSNEPDLPFAEARGLLHHLQHCVNRDSVIQKDVAFETFLAGDDA